MLEWNVILKIIGLVFGLIETTAWYLNRKKGNIPEATHDLVAVAVILMIVHSIN